MSSSEKRFSHAVVIGGSIAGLACARVLSRHFDKVTVLERGVEPQGPTARKHTPQANHCHLFLEAATRGLRTLFPDLLTSLTQGGAMLVDPPRAAALYHYGMWKPRFRSDMESVFGTRPLLEYHVRKHAALVKNVTIRYECTAESLLSSQDGLRITGVRVQSDRGEEVLDADLVVDSEGRGTHLPKWLESLGFGRPIEEKVEIDLAYTSRLTTRPPNIDADLKGIAIYPPFPQKRGAFYFEVEHNQWQLSLTGYLGDHCPTDDEGFLDFAKSIGIPEFVSAVTQTTSLSAPIKHNIPSSRWFHYEKMARFPSGIIAIGDAVCALNPLYGQGVTMAIREVELLEGLLERTDRQELSFDALGPQFQKDVAKVAAQAWLLSTVMDLRFPEVRGNRPPGLAAVQWVFGNLIDATSQSPKACRIFYDLLHMRRGMDALVHPDLLVPVLLECAKSVVVPRERRIPTGPMPLLR